MKQSLMLLAMITVALFLFAACSDDDVSTATTTPTGDNVTGSYAQACAPDADDPNDGVELTLNISSGTGSWTYDLWFSDTTCSGGSDLSLAGTFTMTFVDTKDLASGETVSTMELLDTAETATTNTDVATAAMNAAGATGNSGWGITDWVTGEAQDTLGTNFDATTYTVASEGDIIYLDTSVSPNTLQLGITENDGGAVDADGYPEALETEVWEKQ